MNTHRLSFLFVLLPALFAPIARAQPAPSAIPLVINPGDRVVLIGNTLFDRMQDYGFFEGMLLQKFAAARPAIRTLAWSADEITVRPRPENFGDIHDHLTREKADVILAAYGLNESFRGLDAAPEFEKLLEGFLIELKGHHYNGKSSPRIYLVSPTAHENLGPPMPDGKATNDRLKVYVEIMSRVADKLGVGFVDVFTPSLHAMTDGAKAAPLTLNGIHFNQAGYSQFAQWLYCGLMKEPEHPAVSPALRAAVEDKNRQFFYRYRALNGFYITGGRKSPYGVVNFPGEFQKLGEMTANRDQRLWAIVAGQPVPEKIDDSNTTQLPLITGDRPINAWKSPAQELASFKIDPRFAVNCFASEVDFPELTKPIQIRWDTRGRLWVSTSVTYPQVYPGQGPVDKILILEDINGDGKADKCSTFAEGLSIPLSFEFGDGGIYVSEQPHLTFLKDTDGDGKADFRRVVLTGFGTEDSHHSLHDFTWAPDGDLIFRESIFLHTQVETPYGPVRARESSFYLFRPATQRLIAFGSYTNTNPWGLTFDKWGQHMGSHPIFATAVHALNPPYPQQHVPLGSYIPGAQAYSGVCGHEFITSRNFPDELQGKYVKVRYKPTNEVELHEWVQLDSHFEEKPIGKIFQSADLCFIPVDVRFGPRGDLYVCDWYNPVKGHMQYSLRDTRRDKKSGRIWRVVAKDRPLAEPPKIAGQSVPALLDLLKSYEYRTRYTAKIELRERRIEQVKPALDQWAASLDPRDPEYLHHKTEAMWMYRNLRMSNEPILRELLDSSDLNARAAATRQLRWWHGELPDAVELLRKRANDPSGLVRLEAAIAASYIGSVPAVNAAMDLLKHPMDPTLTYALRTTLDATRPKWDKDAGFRAAQPHLDHFLISSSPEAQQNAKKKAKGKAKPDPFDKLNPKVIQIATVPERMLYTVTEIRVKAGQPLKIIFDNPDASCAHNIVFILPGTENEVGLAAMEMAKGPEGVIEGFIPASKKDKILAASKLINPGEQDILRFHAPKAPGQYPFICTFPGHWLVMKGTMIVE